LVAVSTATNPEPLKPDDLPLDGKQTLAWPMDPETKTQRNGSRLNKVLLLRLDPDGFDAETKDHAVEGVVAYSAVCTHTPDATSSIGTPTRSCLNALAITQTIIPKKGPRS
jgi:Rieske Fe-S protein